MIQEDNFDEEINEYTNENDIGNEMNLNEINEIPDLKKREIDENEKFNLPLTLGNQSNFSKKENKDNIQNFFKDVQFSLYKEFEEKWDNIEKNKIKTLKKTKSEFFDSKSSNSTFYSLNTLQNWKGLINQSRKKFNERILKEKQTNDFEFFVNDKINKIKSLTNYNDSIRRKRILKGKNNNYNNYFDNSFEIKSFLKNDDDNINKYHKINYFRKTQEKIPSMRQKESKLKTKIKNIFGLITQNNDLISSRIDNKFSELSMDELDKNFDEIMSDLSNDYRGKNRISIKKNLKMKNLNNNEINNNNEWIFYSKYDKNLKNKMNIDKIQNQFLINEMLPENGINNFKSRSSNYKYNNKKSLSKTNSSLSKRKEKKIPIKLSSIYGTNNFDNISYKLMRYNSPSISKFLFN